MFSEITIPTNTSSKQHPPSQLNPQAGNLAGRTVKQSNTSRSKLPLPISIQDPHPYIELKELPKNIGNLVEKLNSLQVNLAGTLFVQTSSDLLDIKHYFPKENLKEIHQQLSLIFSIIRSINSTDSMRNPSNYLIFKKAITDILTILVANLKSQWQKIQLKLEGNSEHFTSRKKDSIIEKLNELREVFDYLDRIFSCRENCFEILNCPTIHIQQTKDKKNSTENWLQLILRTYQTMQYTFSLHIPFWNTVPNPDISLDMKTRMELLKKFVKRRLSLKQFNIESLLQLYEMQSPHISKIGELHFGAISLFNSVPHDMRAGPFGFYPQLFNQLVNQINLEEEDLDLLSNLCQTIHPSYVYLHKKQLLILDVLHCAMFADIMKKKGTVIDKKNLGDLIKEARIVSSFLNNFQKEDEEFSIFAIGPNSLSFSDVANLIENMIKVIEELSDSKQETRGSLLLEVYYLRETIGSNMVKALNLSLINLQKRLIKYQKSQQCKKKADSNTIDTIINRIHCIVRIAELLNEKSQIIAKLTQKIHKGTSFITEEKQTLSKPKKKKKGCKKKKNKKTSKSTSKKSLSSKRTEKVPVEEVKPKTKIENEAFQPETVQEENISSEEATQDLISTLSAFQQSVAESYAEPPLTDEKLSLRNVKWRTLCKELINAGFKLKRSSGSHHQYQHPAAKEIGLAIVPIHGKKPTVSYGVVKNVRKQIKQVQVGIT